MNLSKLLKELSHEHLDQILAAIDDATRRFTPDGSSLVEMNAYHMSTGGKRLRALLPLAVASLFDTPTSKLIPFGAACELLHNATLVHDDLQDGDRIRRNNPTVWVKYGEARAINLGDAMLYLTLGLVQELDVDATIKVALTHRFVTETLRVIDGQEREFLLQTMENPTMDDYFQMVEGKTSGLFALPLVGAAQLCEASPHTQEALQEAARHLGVIFQIQDDVLDLYADKGRGARGSDIGEGKMSMLVVHALTHAEEEDAVWLRTLLRRDREEVSSQDIDRVADLFVEVGSLQAAFDEIEDRAKHATQRIASVEDPKLLSFVEQIKEIFLAPLEEIQT